MFAVCVRQTRFQHSFVHVVFAFCLPKPVSSLEFACDLKAPHPAQEQLFEVVLKFKCLTCYSESKSIGSG